MRKLAYGLGVLLLFVGVAYAEKIYYSTDIQPVPGFVVHTLNASGQAVPVSAANPLPRQ